MVVRAPVLLEVLPPFTRADLPALGISRHQLDVLLSAGSVVQPVRGAYLDARCADDTSARARAAGLVLPPRAALARSTAAWVHGFDVRGPSLAVAPLPLEVVVPAGVVVPRRTGLVLHEARLDDGDLCLVDGVLTTSPGRTAVDVARFTPPPMGLAVLDAMAHARAVDLHELSTRLEPLAGQRFVARARRVLDLCEPATESFGESWLRLRFADAGLPRPTVQIWVHEADGRPRYRLDLGWEDVLLSAEYDGQEHHGPLQRAHDEARRDDLRRRGWTVVAVGRGEVLGRDMALERAFADLLGVPLTIRERLW